MLESNQLSQQIVLAIQLSLTPSGKNDIQKAEEMIQQVEKVEGYGPCLLALSINQQLELQLRQGTLAQLKQLVHYHWRSNPNASDPFLISLNDKQLIKQNILQLVENCLSVKVLKKITKQITFEVIENEFPTGWENLHIEAVQSIQAAPQIETVRTPLFILSQIV